MLSKQGSSILLCTSIYLFGCKSISKQIDRNDDWPSPKKQSTIALSEKINNDSVISDELACNSIWNRLWSKNRKRCEVKTLTEICERPDSKPKLKTTIDALINWAETNSCSIMVARVRNTSSIQMSGLQLSMIEPFELAQKVESLYLNQNAIEDPSTISSLPGLQHLYMSYNKIRSIHSLVVPKLETLELSYNPLTDLYPIKRFTELRSLQLHQTTKKDLNIALKPLRKLVSLGLGSNNLTSDELKPLNEMTTLKRLSLNSNAITQIALLATLENLQSLNLANNQITSIVALEKMTNLSVLNLSNNQINKIHPLKNLKELIELNLGSNIIDDISALESLNKLESLNLRGCKVSNYQALLNKKTLRFLDLSNCEKSLTTEESKRLRRNNPEIRLIL